MSKYIWRGVFCVLLLILLALGWNVFRSMENTGIQSALGLQVLSGPESLNSMQLQFAAPAQKDLGEREFYRTISKIRYSIDKQVYPPQGRGSASPGVLLSALGSAFQGSQITTLSPSERQTLLKRLSEWSPKFPMGYDPGWKYTSRLSDAQAEATAKATLAKLMVPIEEQSRLLDNDEYCNLLEKVKEQNEIFYGKGPNKHSWKEMQAAHRRAEEFKVQMHKIECEINPEKRWHRKFKWNAKDFFDDPKAIELADAIEINDLKEIQRLIDEGADVNAPGKDGMTLLLWAMPDANLERFKLLLESGADPAVTMKSNFNASASPQVAFPHSMDKPWLKAGNSVMGLALNMQDKEYFRLVLEHIAMDKPSVQDHYQTVFLSAIKKYRYSEARRLVEAGVSLKPQETRNGRRLNRRERLRSDPACLLIEDQPRGLNKDYESLLLTAKEGGTDFDAIQQSLYESGAKGLLAEIETWTAKKLVAKLGEEELAKIELPEDLATTVFSIKTARQSEPIVKIKADRTFEVKKGFDPEGQYISGSITEDELKWLLHVSVRETRAIHQPQPKKDYDPFDFLHVKVNVASGEDEFVVPYPGDNVELRRGRDLRRTNGLNVVDIKSTISWLRHLGLKVHCGGDAEVEQALDAVNKKLEKLHPDLQKMTPQMLRHADSDEGRVFADFHQRFGYFSGKSLQEVTATYRRIDGEIFVFVSRTLVRERQ